MAVLRVVSALANDALVELIEAVVGQIASTLRSVEQDLNSLSVEIFGEQHTQRKQVKKLGLKRMVQRLRKQNSLIACLREGSVSLAALTSLGKAGLDLLYICIALCTLTTFTFLPSALMYWLLAFWPQLTKKGSLISSPVYAGDLDKFW
jgi:hypothetical protein